MLRRYFICKPDILLIHGTLGSGAFSLSEPLHSHSCSPRSYPSVDLVAYPSSNTICAYVDTPSVGDLLEGIAVYLCGNMLVIEGFLGHKYDPEPLKFSAMERRFAPFRRVVPIPSGISVYSGKVSYENGVLTVSMSTE